MAPKVEGPSVPKKDATGTARKGTFKAALKAAENQLAKKRQEEKEMQDSVKFLIELSARKSRRNGSEADSWVEERFRMAGLTHPATLLRKKREELEASKKREELEAKH